MWEWNIGIVIAMIVISSIKEFLDIIKTIWKKDNNILEILLNNADHIKGYFILILLVLAIIFNISTCVKNKKDDADNKLTLENTGKTLKKADSTIFILSKLKDTLQLAIQTTKSEISLVQKLNEDLSGLRNNIDNNLIKFVEIKNQYERQVEIEKKRIITEKPIVSVIVKSNIDSIDYNIQFVFGNEGTRTADSLIYHLLVIMLDSNLLVKNQPLYRTNVQDLNSIHLPGNSASGQIINFNGFKRKIIKNGSIFFVLMKYKYKDNINDSLISHFQIATSQNIDKNNQQYSCTIPKAEGELIKNYIKRKHSNYYM